MNYKFVKKYANIRNDISKAVFKLFKKKLEKIKFPNKKKFFLIKSIFLKFFINI